MTAAEVEVPVLSSVRGVGKGGGAAQPFARTLQLLGVEAVSNEVTQQTLPILLKYQQDIDKAREQVLGSSRPSSGSR